MIDIEVDSSGLLEISRRFDRIVSLNSDTVERIKEEAVSIYRKESPDRTGAFKESIQVVSENVSDSILNIKIKPQVDYAEFVIEGTAASTGKFYPPYGVRVPYGMHPGFVANPVPDKAAPLIKKRLGNALGSHFATMARNVDNDAFDFEAWYGDNEWNS